MSQYWIKIGKFPWWPARAVTEPSEVPKRILGMRLPGQSCVRFYAYPKSGMFSWVKLDDPAVAVPLEFDSEKAKAKNKGVQKAVAAAQADVNPVAAASSGEGAAEPTAEGDGSEPPPKKARHDGDDGEAEAAEADPQDRASSRGDDDGCLVCRGSDDAAKLVLCDGCDASCHLACMTPPLTAVPRAKWFCPDCIAKGKKRKLTPRGTSAIPLKMCECGIMYTTHPPARSLHQKTPAHLNAVAAMAGGGGTATGDSTDPRRMSAPATMSTPRSPGPKRPRRDSPAKVSGKARVKDTTPSGKAAVSHDTDGSPAASGPPAAAPSPDEASSSALPPPSGTHPTAPDPPAAAPSPDEASSSALPPPSGTHPTAFDRSETTAEDVSPNDAVPSTQAVASQPPATDHSASPEDPPRFPAAAESSARPVAPQKPASTPSVPAGKKGRLMRNPDFDAGSASSTTGHSSAPTQRIDDNGATPGVKKEPQSHPVPRRSDAMTAPSAAGSTDDRGRKRQRDPAATPSPRSTSGTNSNGTVVKKELQSHSVPPPSAAAPAGASRSAPRTRTDDDGGTPSERQPAANSAPPSSSGARAATVKRGAPPSDTAAKWPFARKPAPPLRPSVGTIGNGGSAAKAPPQKTLSRPSSSAAMSASSRTSNAAAAGRSGAKGPVPQPKPTASSRASVASEKAVSARAPRRADSASSSPTSASSTSMDSSSSESSVPPKRTRRNPRPTIAAAAAATPHPTTVASPANLPAPSAPVHRGGTPVPSTDAFMGESLSHHDDDAKDSPLQVCEDVKDVLPPAAPTAALSSWAPKETFELTETIRRIRALGETEYDLFNRLYQPMEEIDVASCLAAWDSTKPAEDLLVNCPGFRTLKRADLQRLAPMRKLNDEVINCFCLLLEARSAVYGPLRCCLPSTYFYPNLVSQGYDNSKQWLKPTFDLDNLDRIILPIHIKSPPHWTCVIIDLICKKMDYMDSTGHAGVEHMQVLADFLKRWHLDRKGTPLDMSTWKYCNPRKEIPQQTNGRDCGVFVMKTMEYAVFKHPVFFNRHRINHFRHQYLLDFLSLNTVV